MINTTQTRTNREANRRHPRKGERGQILFMVAMLMMTMFGFLALTIDTGRVFIGYHQLQASTDAAALAGAQGLPTSSTAVSQATTYSSLDGDKNLYGNMATYDASGTPAVSMASGYPKALCLTTLQNQGIGCDGTTTYNAIQVKQIFNIPTTFAALFGTSAVPLTATSTAAARGSVSTPYNIAVILDQTASMASGGSDSCTDPATSKSYTTRNECSLVGLKSLLLNIAPCGASYTGSTSCPTSLSSAVDMVSVFAFPNFTYSTESNPYSSSCGSNTGSNTSPATNYTFPYLGTAYTTYPSPATPALSGSTADYQLTPWENDYRTNDYTTTLNTSADVVKILGSIGGSSCAGLQAPGGLGTFYAGALAAAQGALLQEQTARGGVTSSKNAIIILSDGAANASSLASTYFNTSVNLPTASSGETTYPYYNSSSTKTNQCQQAVSVRNQIVSDWPSSGSNPTTIYSVAYGATTSTSDCSTDSGAITPCQAMTQIATSSATFFSDYTASGGDPGCISSVQAATGLAQIFGQIAGDFTVARLIPNWTT